MSVYSKPRWNSNTTQRYAEVDGDVRFGTMTAKEAEQYRGSIVINTEEELFYPSLTVGRTMDFATRLNIPNTLPSDAESREDYRLKFKSFLLDSMGIAHTEDTKVGDAFVRGVSGGERKRVSIIETLCTRGSVVCWDNSVRLESIRLGIVTDSDTRLVVLTPLQLSNTLGPCAR